MNYCLNVLWIYRTYIYMLWKPCDQLSWESIKTKNNKVAVPSSGSSSMYIVCMFDFLSLFSFLSVFKIIYLINCCTYSIYIPLTPPNWSPPSTILPQCPFLFSSEWMTPLVSPYPDISSLCETRHILSYWGQTRQPSYNNKAQRQEKAFGIAPCPLSSCLGPTEWTSCTSST